MDINTISELLVEFVSAEKEILDSQNIKHPTTIGTMYEGLTEEILNRSVFLGLGLKVVTNSFIEGCDSEFDVMLVIGDGEKIPYTDRYKYQPDRVVAIIQVKKNLYSKDLKEGYENLQFLINHFEEVEPDKYVGRIFRDGFRMIAKKDVTVKNSGELSDDEELIFTTLRIEALLPIRIIWGYNGFASEFKFRESFFDYLKQNTSTDVTDKVPGFGPNNFPNLIICDKYALIKQNGMPFGYSKTENEWWPFYTSTSYNPTYFFLETIWSRLSYMFEQIPTEIFGEDLSMEPVNRFLEARVKKTDTHLGWEYNYFFVEKKTLEGHVEVAAWEPAEIDEIQHVIITELCEKGEIDLVKDKDLQQFVLSGNYASVEQFLDSLKDTGLVYIEKDKLRLLTDRCQCAVLPNGKFYAGEDKSGRFTNWILKQMERK